MRIPTSMTSNNFPVLRVRMDRRKKGQQEVIKFLKNTNFRLAIRHVQRMDDAEIVYKGRTYRGLEEIRCLVLALLTRKTLQALA
ncbi:MAG: hypothetical protein Athens071426_399 [Parcubacteria group bacterium Athens0714_26]|nr:MAG: hypothetical protein Athens071426_399 [Parcubacteria group bacterium Athens0714_26]